MNLNEAKFKVPLKIVSVHLDADSAVFLRQLGLEENEIIEKIHVAPLGDPITLKIAGQLFSLRNEICKSIEVTEWK